MELYFLINLYLITEVSKNLSIPSQKSQKTFLLKTKNKCRRANTERKDLSSVSELTFLRDYTTLLLYKLNDYKTFTYIRVDVNGGGLKFNVHLTLNVATVEFGVSP